MFKVKNLTDNNIYIVYDIQYDGAGYPHFLIYQNNQWIRKSAKHFQPYQFLTIK